MSLSARDRMIVGLDLPNLKEAERMVAHLTGQSDELVREALRRADGSVKLAVLLLQGYSVSEAQAALDGVDGRLRAALDHLAKHGAPNLEDAKGAR